MRGSLTTPGRSSTRITRPTVLPSAMTTASAPGAGFPFAARWLAYALPYRRFAAALTDDDARLGADVDRYSFIVTDLHRLLLAGLSRRTVIENSGSQQQARGERDDKDRGDLPCYHSRPSQILARDLRENTKARDAV
jgi:hypothetical protein